MATPSGDLAGTPSWDAGTPSWDLKGSEVTASTGSDWSQCPLGCKCKWASGKRTADCSASGLQSLPLFPQPELIQVGFLAINQLDC